MVVAGGFFLSVIGLIMIFFENDEKFIYGDENEEEKYYVKEGENGPNDTFEKEKQYIIENQWDKLNSTSHKMQMLFEGSGIELSHNYDTPRKKIVSITDCECLIAQTGSVVVTDKCAGSRAAFSLSDILLIYARPSQIVANMKNAIRLLKERYNQDRPSETVIISGASRSNEIDNQLVIGAQGIKQLALFLVEDE